MFQEWEQQRDCFLWTAPLFLLIILHQIFYTEYLTISHLYRKYYKNYKNSKSFYYCTTSWSLFTEKIFYFIIISPGQGAVCIVVRSSHVSYNVGEHGSVILMVRSSLTTCKVKSLTVAKLAR